MLIAFVLTSIRGFIVVWVVDMPLPIFYLMFMLILSWVLFYPMLVSIGKIDESF